MSLAEEEQEEDLEVEEPHLEEDQEEEEENSLGTAVVVDAANCLHHCLKADTLVREQVLVEA